MTPLHRIGEFVREVLLQIPLSAVRVLFVLIPAALLVWVLTLPKEATHPQEPTGRWGENLKIGAAIALGLQVVIYLVL